MSRQSAVNNALARLRRLLDDPLVMRHGWGVVPTPRSEDVPSRSDRPLGARIDRRGFIAAVTTRTFTIALSDNYQACKVPRIARAFATRMPQATLRVVRTDYLAESDGLANGDIDVTFSPKQAVLLGRRSAALFEERAALIIRQDHPRVRTRMTREL